MPAVDLFLPKPIVFPFAELVVSTENNLHFAPMPCELNYQQLNEFTIFA